MSREYYITHIKDNIYLVWIHANSHVLILEDNKLKEVEHEWAEGTLCAKINNKWVTISS